MSTIPQCNWCTLDISATFYNKLVKVQTLKLIGTVGLLCNPFNPFFVIFRYLRQYEWLFRNLLNSSRCQLLAINVFGIKLIYMHLASFVISFFQRNFLSFNDKWPMFLIYSFVWYRIMNITNLHNFFYRTKNDFLKGKTIQ